MFRVCSLLLSLFLSHSIEAKVETHSDAQKSFVIIVPSYNNKKWYRYNLDSLLLQSYDNFRIIYVDDVSNDGMSDLVMHYIAAHPRGDKVTYIRNTVRVGALANIYMAVMQCDPHEIVVLVDGDDWLEHDQVLAHLDTVYTDPNVWMTYGQFRRTNGDTYRSSLVPQEYITQKKIRNYPWTASHLRTFYAGLFHKINKEDLLYNGSFFSMAWDMAIMYPMLEMAGVHSRFIPQVLYVYNTENPISDGKIDRTLQLSLDRYIRAKRPYDALEKLF